MNAETHSRGFPVEVAELDPDVSSDAPIPSVNAFLVCWGDHTGGCALTERYASPEAAHDPWVELDYDDAGHRLLLRWLKREASPDRPIHTMPRLTPEAEERLHIHGDTQKKG